jgi:hypothetical protein
VVSLSLKRKAISLSAGRKMKLRVHARPLLRTQTWIRVE